MPSNSQNPQPDRSGASSQPESKGEWVRRTCPKLTPRKPPKWVSKKEAVGGRCNYIDPEGSLCPHWRARDSDACSCHVEAYEGPDSTAGMRLKRPRKKRPRIVGMIEPDPSLSSKPKHL